MQRCINYCIILLESHEYSFDKWILISSKGKIVDRDLQSDYNFCFIIREKILTLYQLKL